MLSPWARKMKAIYAFVFFLVALIFVGFFVSFLLSSEETCYDGVQNQTETAPDKGGPCKLLDERLLAPLDIKWVRTFPVREQVNSAIAFVDNPNKDAGILEVEYIFTLYNKDNLLVTEKEGKTYIIPGMINPIFEPEIDISRYDVRRAAFRFKGSPIWYRMRNTVSNLKVYDLKAYDLDKIPKIKGLITNTDIYRIDNIDLIAIVYDTYGNAIAASKTYIDSIEGGGIKEFVFSWPKPFKKDIGRVDVIPRVKPNKNDLIGD